VAAAKPGRARLLLASCGAGAGSAPFFQPEKEMGFTAHFSGFSTTPGLGGIDLSATPSFPLSDSGRRDARACDPSGTSVRRCPRHPPVAPATGIRASPATCLVAVPAPRCLSLIVLGSSTVQDGEILRSLRTERTLLGPFGLSVKNS
jgi:hypothetical protein